MDGKKYITIATDASISPTYKLATWACYIVTPLGVVQYAAPLKEGQDCGIAELYAIANALAILDRNVKQLEQYHVIIYSDYIDVMALPTTKAGAIRKRALARSYVIDEYITPIANKVASFEVRHIKAHTSHLTTKWGKPHHMNHWCDQQARRMLRQLIRQKKTEGTIEV